MIYNLQSLRGLLAIAVLAAHFGFNSDLLTNSGDIRIAGFMMLSAFVFTLSCLRRADRNELPKPGRFMWKRLVQLYPLYLAGVILTLAIKGFHQGIKPTVADLLMIQSWIPDKTYYFSGNPPTWFISSIMFCYLAFLPAFRLAYFKPKVFATFMASYLICYFLITLNVQEEYVHGMIYIFPPMQFATYLCGIVLAFLCYYRNVSIKSPYLADLAVFGVLAVMFVLLLFAPSVSPRFTLSSYWWLPVFALLLVLTAIENTNCLTTRVLHSRLLLSLGNVSFGFYILHYPWIHGSRAVLDFFNINLPIGLEYCLSIPILAILAWLSKKYFEAPIVNKFK